ncbi:MAG TPA: DUF2239 family protein [Longimicrobiales bacterium]|nr:DUF2239 family protein [Longimicrobiales bacterium]
MFYDQDTRCTAFLGQRRIAGGLINDVARKVKDVIGHDANAPVFIYDDATARPVEIDFRGTANDVIRRLTPPPRGRGRPKLGVEPREITLLPRHWDWLNSQPGGASAAIRRLVEDAKRSSAQKDAARIAQDSAYRFMSGMAGNEEGFEEATRALFAKDREGFEVSTSSWPNDVRAYALHLAAQAF